jgi:SulP family sulfate permease
MRVLPGLTRHNILRESASGITLLAIAVPLNIGYAQIAGLPPTAGLYALVLPSIAFALIASSRQLVVSPDAAAAALVGSSIGGLAIAGSENYLELALAQAVVGGIIFLFCAFFKLGFLASFLSEPILIGFVGGLALDILVSQVAKMLGVPIDSGAEFVAKVVQLLGGLGTTSLWSLALAAAAVVVLVLGRRVARAVPWALVVLVAGTLTVALLDLRDRGVKVLGAVEAGAPVFTWPSLSWAEWLSIVPSAAALTLVAIAEGLLVSRKYGQKNGYPTNPNRDLLGFGVANIASGLTGGFTVGSSTSRTAAVDQLGTRTQAPALVAALGTLLLLMFGTALLEEIPSPVIGAVVAVAVLPLLGIRELVELWRQRRFEFAIGATCFLGTLLLGPIVGILIAFVLSLLNLALRAANPPVDLLSRNDIPDGSLLPLEHGRYITAPGVVVVRFAAPLFFANAAVFDAAVRRAVEGGKPLGLRHLVLDCEAITDIDVTGAKSFREIVGWLESQQVELHLSRVRPDLVVELGRFGLLGSLRTHGTNRQAIAALAEQP